jgi:hypothetical protein
MLQILALAYLFIELIKIAGKATYERTNGCMKKKKNHYPTTVKAEYKLKTIRRKFPP